MGYDMYWCQDWRDEEAYAAAYRFFNQAVSARDTGDGDQSTVEEAASRMSAAEPGHFRLNIWGMGQCRDLMGNFEMIYDSAPDAELGRLVNQVQSESDETAEDLVDAYVRSGVASRPGIAMHKFYSNDCWVVTPMECVGALTQWRKWCDENDFDAELGVVVPGGEELPEWWGEWLDYLSSAALHGGFRVF